MWGQTRWAQTRWGRAIWRSGVSAAAAILLAMTSILGSGTPTYAQAAVGTGSQVLRVEVLRGGYANTDSYLHAAYEGSQWVFQPNGTFVFTPSAGQGSRRTGTYTQTSNGLEFEATG